MRKNLDNPKKKKKKKLFPAGVETKQPTQGDGGRACKNPTWPKKNKNENKGEIFVSAHFL
jgi:hypothetical protein